VNGFASPGDPLYNIFFPGGVFLASRFFFLFGRCPFFRGRRQFVGGPPSTCPQGPSVRFMKRGSTDVFLELEFFSPAVARSFSPPNGGSFFLPAPENAFRDSVPPRSFAISLCPQGDLRRGFSPFFTVKFSCPRIFSFLACERSACFPRTLLHGDDVLTSTTALLFPPVRFRGEHEWPFLFIHHR